MSEEKTSAEPPLRPFNTYIDMILAGVADCTNDDLAAARSELAALREKASRCTYDHIERIEKENAALREDRKRLRASLARVGLALVEAVGGDHEALHDDPDCPSDDTCRCVAVQLVNDAARAGSGTS